MELERFVCPWAFFAAERGADLCILLDPIVTPEIFAQSVVDDYGLETVQEYMYHIRNNAETSVRNLLKDVAKRAGSNILEAIDYLDDGSPVSICFAIHHPSASLTRIYAP